MFIWSRTSRCLVVVRAIVNYLIFLAEVAFFRESKGAKIKKAKIFDCIFTGAATKKVRGATLEEK